MHLIKNFESVEYKGFLQYNNQHLEARIQEIFIWISAYINAYIVWE